MGNAILHVLIVDHAVGRIVGVVAQGPLVLKASLIILSDAECGILLIANLAWLAVGYSVARADDPVVRPAVGAERVQEGLLNAVVAVEREAELGIYAEAGHSVLSEAAVAAVLDIAPDVRAREIAEAALVVIACCVVSRDAVRPQRYVNAVRL